MQKQTEEGNSKEIAFAKGYNQAVDEINDNKTLADIIYHHLTGSYVVQTFNDYDVQQAVGDDKLKYTPEQMEELRDILEEETYIGDDWCTIINNFNDQQ